MHLELDSLNINLTASMIRLLQEVQQQFQQTAPVLKRTTRRSTRRSSSEQAYGEEFTENMDYVTPYVICNRLGHTIQGERVSRTSYRHLDAHQDTYKFLVRDNHTLNLRLDENCNQPKIISISLGRYFQPITDINLDRLGQQEVLLRNRQHSHMYKIVITKNTNNMLRQLLLSSPMTVTNHSGTRLRITLGDKKVVLSPGQEYSLPYDALGPAAKLTYSLEGRQFPSLDRQQFPPLDLMQLMNKSSCLHTYTPDHRLHLQVHSAPVNRITSLLFYASLQILNSLPFDIVCQIYSRQATGVSGQYTLQDSLYVQ